MEDISKVAFPNSHPEAWIRVFLTTSAHYLDLAPQSAQRPTRASCRSEGHFLMLHRSSENECAR